MVRQMLLLHQRIRLSHYLIVQNFRYQKMLTMSICENNTIYGTKFKTLPNTKGKNLVADILLFLIRAVDVTKYGLLFGGVQKNIGPAL